MGFRREGYEKQYILEEIDLSAAPCIFFNIFPYIYIYIYICIYIYIYVVIWRYITLHNVVGVM